MLQQRLDRQLRIEGWDQFALGQAKIGVVGDTDSLASLFVLSASALGINNLVVVAPVLDKALVRIAEKLNPLFTLTHLEGFYTHSVLGDLLKGCSLVVDLSSYGLANKLLVQKGFGENLPIVRGWCYEQNNVEGFKIFTYMRGREWQELGQIISHNNLPGSHFYDDILGIIVAGIVLEESKNILMGKAISDAVISYSRNKLTASMSQPNILVIGAGALGTFVGLGLGYLGFQHCTFMDPDVVEVANLNRQLLLYDAFGASKAETLAGRLNDLFGMNSNAEVAFFGRDTDLSPYDVVFDCADNFETKIVLSEECKDKGKILISGGTSAEAGQAVLYNPGDSGVTPAEFLGLYEIVSERTAATALLDKASCTYQPDPSVVMTNQITAGFMLDAYRMLLDGQRPRNIFYDSRSSERSWIET